MQKLKDKEPVTKQEIHQFWYLEHSLNTEYPLLNIKEPEVVTTLRGWPQNAGPFATSGLVESPQIAPGGPNANAPSLCRTQSAWEMGNVGEVEDIPSRAPKVKKAKSTSRMAPRAQGGTSRARSSHRGIHYDSGQGRNTVAAFQGETAP